MHCHAHVAHQVTLSQHCIIFDVGKYDTATLVDTGGLCTRIPTNLDRTQAKVRADFVNADHYGTFKLIATIGFHIDLTDILLEH